MLLFQAAMQFAAQVAFFVTCCRKVKDRTMQAECYSSNNLYITYVFLFFLGTIKFPRVNSAGQRRYYFSQHAS